MGEAKAYMPSMLALAFLSTFQIIGYEPFLSSIRIFFSKEVP